MIIRYNNQLNSSISSLKINENLTKNEYNVVI